MSACSEPARSGYSAPSPTTSSGCSMALGAMPEPWCSSVAASGIRLDPPTRNTAEIGDFPAADAVMAICVAVTVRSRIFPYERKVLRIRRVATRMLWTESGRSRRTAGSSSTMASYWALR